MYILSIDCKYKKVKIKTKKDIIKFLKSLDTKDITGSIEFENNISESLVFKKVDVKSLIVIIEKELERNEKII